MADARKTVTVQSVELHTYDGKSYDVGDTYDIDEQYADSVEAQGKAFRVSDPTTPKAAPKASHPMAPLTADDIPTTTKKHK